MRYFTYTYVDAQTGRPVTENPAVNGPMAPEGVVFGFALESRYPTETPTFYGKKEGALDLPGIISVITKAEYDAAEAAEMEARSDLVRQAVNAEASRRIASGFEFQGKMYDYDDKAQKRITGAATLAGFAAAAGAPEGYLTWHGGDHPFAWIAMDNSLTPMDAPTCFAFGQAAAAWESAHVVGPKSARALKDTPGGIPADFADDKYWP